MTDTLLIDSPVGSLRLSSDGHALTTLRFVDDDAEAGGQALAPAAVPVLVEARRQLEEYFAGDREAFDLPLAAVGTPFQRRVWDRLVEIPFGVTTSYGEIAADLGMPPGGSRAIGLANGANPIAIVVPCHRVIGANGNLTGYGGGIERKQYLLGLESRKAPQATLFD